jgi:hypothetical protein
MNQVMNGTKTRKLIVQLVSGAVVGAAVSYFFFRSMDGAANLDDPARLAAVAAGIIYVLMGAIVAIGAMLPGAGARILNVEDADEIVEERGKLTPSAIACLLVGTLLLALALTPGGDLPGALSRDAAAYIAAGSFAALVVVSLWMRGRIDEFNRSLGTESAALALYLSALLFGGWGALAHLGYVEWIAPLGVLAGFALLQLGAVFWVVGRRGLLMPR